MTPPCSPRCARFTTRAIGCAPGRERDDACENAGAIAGPASSSRPTGVAVRHSADGAEGLVLADLARAVAASPAAPAISVAVICRDGQRMAALSRSLAFFAPDIDVLEFPAWDCLPYDRASPHAAIVAQRMTALARLVRVKGGDRPAILLTPVNAILQRVPPRETLSRQSLSAAPGNLLAMSGVVQWLEVNGFTRAGTVREAGDYAVRGGIVDLFAPGMGDPVRLDFFGYAPGIDPQPRSGNRCATPRGAAHARSGADGGIPAHHGDRPDVPHRLCRGLRSGGARRHIVRSRERRPPRRRHQTLAAAVSPAAQTLFDYLDATPLAIEPLAEEAAHERLAQIGDYYQARKDALDQPGQGEAARRTSRCRRIGSIWPRPNGANGSTERRWRGCRRLRRRTAVAT